ncbi:hypothetical protein Q757_00550 [Oenococcus alcoholitolerans]|uniref:Uncharacterized protein n=1 Tax=Oenococcus alcoholitolerans TaxID=931074 RepID=A0ABR4XTZ7_9LACO|nr:hypothetical protein Q757_00550 [Oenococcus alcoholitolerans]
MNIHLLYEPRDSKRTAAALQWLKFQIQFIVNLHDAISLFEFNEDAKDPLFQIFVFQTSF